MRNLNKKMIIGFVYDYQPNIGGATECVIRLVRALKKLDIKPKLIAHPKSWITDFDEKNVELIFADKVKLTFIGYVPYTFTKVEKITSLYKKKRLDLCHAHFALPYGITTYLAKQICGIPYIVTLHGSDVHVFAKTPSLKPVMKLCLENADAITCVSHALKKSLITKLKLKKEVHVISNFVNTEVYRKKKGCQKIKKQLGIPRENFIVTHISNFAKIKNTLIIPDIAKKVIETHPKTTFLMVGEALDKKGYDLERLKEKIAEYGLNDHFVFTGRRKDVSRILNISNATLLTSYNEGAPLVILESMAVGVPAVASKVGGIPELIKHNKQGFTIIDHDIEEFADSINMLIENPELRKKMGTSAVKRINDKFSQEIIVEQYINLYKKIKAEQ